MAVENAAGGGATVLLCDHASNRIPESFAGLGLAPAEREAHIAWDPGALQVARIMSAALDAPLVYPTVSRLLIDCNRPLDSNTLIAASSAGTPVRGNEGLDRAERQRRIEAFYEPYHRAVSALLDKRAKAGLASALVSVHSFTRTLGGRERPWHLGLVFGRDRRLADVLLAALHRDGDLAVGENQPYSPADEVYTSVERHGEGRGLPCVMIELGNDLIETEADQRRWGERLAALLERAVAQLLAAQTDAR